MQSQTEPHSKTLFQKVKINKYQSNPTWEAEAQEDYHKSKVSLDCIVGSRVALATE